MHPRAHDLYGGGGGGGGGGVDSPQGVLSQFLSLFPYFPLKTLIDSRSLNFT
jgi:hypothetical protein